MTSKVKIKAHYKESRFGSWNPVQIHAEKSMKNDYQNLVEKDLRKKGINFIDVFINEVVIVE